jgi:hypothetical protein
MWFLPRPEKKLMQNKTLITPFIVYSSPEPKAHVRYCHHLASHAGSVVICVVVVRKKLHFNLFLWNHWVNWNQSWQEYSLDGPLEKLCFEGFLLIGNTQKKQQPQRYQKGCCLFLIFYETTGPIGTKYGRNVHLMVL